MALKVKDLGFRVTQVEKAVGKLEEAYERLEARLGNLSCSDSAGLELVSVEPEAVGLWEGQEACTLDMGALIRRYPLEAGLIVTAQVIIIVWAVTATCLWLRPRRLRW